MSGDNDRRRFILALALAVAVHEVLAGVIPARRSRPQPTRTVVTVARVLRIVRRPLPTPKPVVRVKRIAPTVPRPRVIAPARPAPKAHIRRKASARPRVKTKHHRKPVVHIPMGGHGAGTSRVAKAPTGGASTGGTGTGERGAGTGTGGMPAAHEPCGYVDFLPNAAPTVDQSTGRIWEHIEMVVHFPDGSSQTVDLDYPWYYPNHATDPFFPENSSVPATFQFPPASLRPGEPPLVLYVMAHTSPDGYTLLHDCPK